MGGRGRQCGTHTVAPRPFLATGAGRRSGEHPSGPSTDRPGWVQPHAAGAPQRSRAVAAGTICVLAGGHNGAGRRSGDRFT